MIVDESASARSRVLQALRAQSAASRAELALACGLSRPAVGAVIDALLAEGLVLEADAVISGLGRPGRPLRLDDRQHRFAVAELSADGLRWRLLPAAPPEQDAWSGLHPIAHEPALIALLRTVIAGHSLTALALALPGVLDEAADTVLFSHRLPWTVGSGLAARLSAALGCPVQLCHEIRALALGHHARSPHDRDFMLVDAGAGLGAAAVIGGHLHRAGGALAGEIGHSPVPGQRQPCGCGGLGCLETVLAAGQAERASLATLRAAGTIIGGACNALGLDRVLLSGDLATIIDRKRQGALVAGIASACLAGRLDRLQVEVVERQRQRGLHQLLSRTYLDRGTASQRPPSLRHPLESA